MCILSHLSFFKVKMSAYLLLQKLMAFHVTNVKLENELSDRFDKNVKDLV